MPSWRTALPLSCLLLVLGVACDEPTSNPVSNPAGDAAATKPEPKPDAKPEPDAKPTAPAEPVEPAPPVGGPSCDQRELVDADGEPRRLCVDYSEHHGASEPRCFEGVELGEGPCPREGVIASCELTATGVTMLHYEGAGLDKAQRDCGAIRGVYRAD